MPLLIGGATTSAKHTAVQDRSRLRRPDRPRARCHPQRRCRRETDQPGATGVRRREYRASTAVGGWLRGRQQQADPLRKKPAKSDSQTDWSTVRIDQPSFIGVRVLTDFPLQKSVKYIDWSPFFMTWELKGKYPTIFEDPTDGTQAKELYDDANDCSRIMSTAATHGQCGLWFLAGGQRRR